MGISVKPLHPHVGAEITGIDLRQPVPPETFAEVEAALNKHAVLILPAQPIIDEQQIVFSRLFGPLETSPKFAGSQKMRLRDREMVDISNLEPEGRVMSADDKRLLFNRGNQLWHTDSSVKDRAALFIIKDAEERESLRPGGVIVKGTAGNTGIGLALVGNARGYRTVIVIPDTQTEEKKDKGLRPP